MPYRRTKKATGDIRHIYGEGRRLFGKAQADAYHLHLERMFEMLASNPKLARLRDEITRPVGFIPRAHI